ncbi:M23 family metallopeptidase [Sandarakinorhabdus sp. AAP62]|uniref:M23 family metallopeptidase n=1 Tax=Sandarakinorhabdus sp. AAP62 TaxID=1248916 RepID=UPI000300A455|nr:M23 family metallopeptidase [Sandarakinorhabdus sp. AAP62]
MHFLNGTLKMAALGLIALVVAAPAAANDSLAAFSADLAVSAMMPDDRATNQASSMADARREFLAALTNEHTDAATLSRMLPRAGQPVAALIGAAPAGMPRAEAVLRRLGLNPDRFLAGRTGVGGPFIAATDPQVRDLQADAARRAAITATFARIPAFLPVSRPAPSSDFGYRSDPFHGGGAFHAGIDMTGKTGDAIHAAADGVVVRAGWWAGYGKVVVIDHGNGLETRYGHMTRFHVKEGDVIRQGQVVGGMGSTGRSTGTHLHFEIRLDGRAVDPQPFLDLASFGVDAPVRSRPTVIAPLNIASDEPFAPLVSDDMVMAGGRSWKARHGR